MFHYQYFRKCYIVGRKVNRISFKLFKTKIAKQSVLRLKGFPDHWGGQF